MSSFFKGLNSLLLRIKSLTLITSITADLAGIMDIFHQAFDVTLLCTVNFLLRQYSLSHDKWRSCLCFRPLFTTLYFRSTARNMTNTGYWIFGYLRRKWILRETKSTFWLFQLADDYVHNNTLPANTENVSENTRMIANPPAPPSLSSTQKDVNVFLCKTQNHPGNVQR